MDKLNVNGLVASFVDFYKKQTETSKRKTGFNYKEYQKWFDSRISLPNNLIEGNSYLYGLYNLLSEQKDDDDIVKSEAINILKNLIEAKNDELLDLFMNVTRDFFTSGKDPLMEKYHLNHHFTYYYITIRDKKWPRGVFFEWYPLGLKKLCSSNELTFGFKNNGKRIPYDVEQNLIELGFEYFDKSKSYRKSIVVPRGEDFCDGTFIGLYDNLQKAFLEDVYQKYAEPIIKNIIPKIK